MLRQISFGSLGAEWSSVPWEELTKLEEKKELYRFEPFFRESWSDLLNELGRDAVGALHRHATICFLPDATAGRRIWPGINFLQSQGFEVVSIQEVNYDWQIYNAEWRFQINDTTLERISLSHDLCERGPVLFVLLRDKSTSYGVPATVRLRRMKGASNPKLRTGKNLRDTLNSTNRLLKFIHTSDEPIDLVRVLGSTMERPDRLSVIQNMKASSPSPRMPDDEIKSKLDDLYRRQNQNDLNVETSIKTIVETLQTYRPAALEDQAAADEALKIVLDALIDVCPLDYLKFKSLLRKMDTPLDDWTVICGAADLIRHKYEEETSIIASDGSPLWLEKQPVQRSEATGCHSEHDP